jgi:hypothetical protein
MDAALATAAGADPADIVVVPRRRTRRATWPWAAAGWGRVEAGPALDALLAAGPDGVALVPDPADDAGAAVLGPLSALAGVEAVRLPRPASAAAWTAGLAVAWRGMAARDLVRLLQVAAGLAGAPGGLPRRRWEGDETLAVPALRPAVLARWAVRSWRPCAWCAGGGLPGRACGRCGVPLACGSAPCAA